MKIHITIEPGKYTGKVLFWVGRHRLLTIMLVLLSGFAVWAAAVAKPFTFSTGGVVSASEVNSNFDTLYNTVAQRLGTFCGFTAATYDGSTVGGYAGAKNKCETACGDTRAHMCSTHEIVITQQLGISMAGSGNGFYSVGARSTSTLGGANYISDCTGWTSNAATQYGAGIQNTGALIDTLACSNPYKIVCCL